MAGSKGALVALLTDFGVRDPYVAAMKGVIYSINPSARIADLTHEVPRHDVAAAAFQIRSVEPYYPRGTIFVCVVDPGVGSARRLLCLRTRGMLFMAPDNGLLNYVSDGSSRERWYNLRRPRSPVSPTFHGRDILAPAAARLSTGVSLGRLAGPAKPLPPRSLLIDVPARGKRVVLRGMVLHVDRFGNIVTNLRVKAEAPAPTAAGDDAPGRWSLRIGGRTIHALFRTYAAASEGRFRRPFMIVGSTGLLEVSVDRGSAAEHLGVGPGHTAVLTA